MASNATPVTVREAMLASQFDHTGRFTVNTRTKAASLAVAAALLAPLVATFGAPTAFASTSVTSAGTVLPGGTSGGTASFTFTENSANAFPTSGGNLVVGITDYAGGSTVHFVGTATGKATGTANGLAIDKSWTFTTDSKDAMGCS